MRNVWKYYLFSFTTALTFFSGVLIPFYTEWGGITQFQIQFLQAWFMFWVFFLEVPTGAVADYFGRKYSIALGALIFGIGMFVYASQPNFTIFLFAEFLAALGIALQSGADEALLYDSLKKDNKESLAKGIISKSRSIELVVLGLSAVVGSTIASRLGLNYPMIFTGFSLFVSSIIALTFFEPTNSGFSESKRYLMIVKSGLLYVKNHPSLKLIVFDGISVAASAYFVIWLYQRFLGVVGIPILWFGMFHLILTLAQVTVNLNSHHLERILGSIKNYLKFSGIAVGAGFILLAVWPSIWTVMFFILISGGFGLTRMTYLTSHINKLIESEQRATVLSFLSMFRRFTLVILNPLVGAFIDKSATLTLIILGSIPIFVSILSPIKASMLSEPRSKI